MSRTPATVAQARAIAAEFVVAPSSVVPLGKGLINDTFAVDGPEGAFVLQRVHEVFAPEIHLNIDAVTRHLARAGMVTPRLRPTRDGRGWIDDDRGVWRMMTRLPGVSLDTVEHPSQAHAAGELLGRFHSTLADLQHEFVGLRLGVHDTPAHLRALHEAVAEHHGHRLYDEVARLADAIEADAATMPPLTGLPARIVHGDPKLNNVLFDGPRGPARCWIDLDTVAPMPLAIELGDAWRSWCNPSGEDQAQARFDLEVFEASLSGYRRGCSLALGADERESLRYGVEWITLELATRFAADALAERYFGWDRTRFPAAGEHNLCRARGQWSLHEAVMACRSERQRRLDTGW